MSGLVGDKIPEIVTAPRDVKHFPATNQSHYCWLVMTRLYVFMCVCQGFFVYATEATIDSLILIHIVASERVVVYIAYVDGPLFSFFCL